MEKRKFGRTGLDISVLTFGCGAVGGLMTKGAPADQERAVARALEAGVNHFDTAPAYGDGASEQNIGRVLASLKPDIVLSTKVRVPAQRPDIGAAIAASLDASLKRLKRDRVDVFQLHNTVAARADGPTMSVDEVLSDVVPALNLARAQGKTRFIGFTAIGETEALLALIASGAFDTAQVPYNALNPSAGRGDCRRLSGAGLRLHPRPRGGKGRRHHRHPCSRGRRAVGARGAQPARLAGGRADRVGCGLRQGCGARQTAGADGAGGPCVELDRDGDALRRLQSRSYPPPRSGLPTSTNWTRR